MRMRLVGYTGERPPVPGVTPVDPIDPGPTPTPDPSTIPDPVVLMLNNGDLFHKLDYLAEGYNHFDVMCFGGAGGNGGGFYHTRGDGIRRHYGGAGGGGGVHRVKGRLILLPTECAVVVGAQGADGVFNIVSDGADPFVGLTDGSPGGYSSFGGTVCRASGGLGGKKRVNTFQYFDAAHGGDYVGGYVPGGQIGGISAGGLGGAGGIGNSITPGGGGAGGSKDGAVGTWDGAIGSGGGGGKGGLFNSPDQPYNAADIWTHPWNVATAAYYVASGAGGKGAYSAADPTVAGDGATIGGYFSTDYLWMDDAGGGNFTYHWTHGDIPIIPGPGGGAEAFPLNGSLLQWGSRAGGINGSVGSGAVIIRLSYLIV